MREAANEDSYREAKQAIREIARDRGFDLVTVEVEFADEACAMR